MIVLSDFGGSILDRAGDIAAIERRQEAVEVRGACMSACTMLLAVTRLCVRPGAWFGFHRPTGGSAGVADAATDLMWRHYPVGLQELLGALRAEMAYLRGRDLLALGIARECR